MKQARLILDTNLIGRSRTGLVYVGMVLKVDGIVFPEEGWVDFGVVVLSWWSEAATRLFNGNSEQEELRFMDGPYLVELLRMDGCAWKIRCIEAGKACSNCILEECVAADAFLNSLLESADVLLRLCRQRHWWDDDAAKLQINIGLLRRQIEGNSKPNQDK